MAALSFLRFADWLDFERVRRIGVVAAVLVIAAIAWNSWDHTRYGLTNASGEQLGVDFVNYWSGAHLAAEGRAPLAYDIKGFVAYERAHTSPNAMFRWYSYPPVTMLLTSPLALLPFIPALIFWLLAGALVWAAVLSRILDWRMALIAAFGAPASFMNFVAGQNGFLTAILFSGGILALRTRPLVAGILFGMLCYKPQFGILLPFALAAGGYWRTFASAALTVLALVALSVLLLGGATWTAFLHTAPYNHLLMEQGSGFWRRMPTPFSFVRLMGGTIFLAYAAQIVSAALAIAATVFVWRGRASFAVKSGALIFGTFLVTPYAWDYDLVILTFAVAMLAVEAAKTGFQPWERITLAMVIAMPVLLTIIATATHIQIGPFILWAAFAFVLRRALDARRMETASHDDPKYVSLGAGNLTRESKQW